MTNTSDNFNDLNDRSGSTGNISLWSAVPQEEHANVQMYLIVEGKTSSCFCRTYFKIDLSCLGILGQEI